MNKNYLLSIIKEELQNTLQELDVRPVAGVQDWARTPELSRALTNQQKLDYNKASREFAKGNIDPKFGAVVIELAKTSANVAAMLLDFTGQFAGYDFDTGEVTTSAEVLDQEVRSFRKKPSLAGAAGVALASLSMIPLIGGLGKLNKISKMPKTMQLNKRIKTVIEDSQKISKELKASGTAENVAKADKIDDAIKVSLDFRKKALFSQRVGTRINALNKQLGERFFRNIKSGKVKADGKPFVIVLSKDSKNIFNLGSDWKRSITAPKKVVYTIVPAGKNTHFPRGQNISLSGSWDDVTHEIKMTFSIDTKLINPDGTIPKKALSDVKEAIAEGNVHEIWHGRQYWRTDAGAKDKVADAIRKSEAEGGTPYVGNPTDPRYRVQPREVESWARQNIPSWQSIRKAKKAGKEFDDTISVLLRTLDHRSPALQDHIVFLLKQKPCAPVTVANWLDMVLLDERGNFRREAFGRKQRVVDRTNKMLEKIRKMNKNKIIPINPGACGKMLESMHPDIVEILKELKIHPRGCRKAMRENYLRRIILEEIQAVLSSQ